MSNPAIAVERFGGGPWAARLAAAALLAAIILLGGRPTVGAQIVGAVALLLSFRIAAEFHGWTGAALMLGTCCLITFAIENLGVATGFPFGAYHFEADRGLPYIGRVPLIVGPLYFGVGYFAWIIAGILLGDADPASGRGLDAVARPIAAAFIMVQWDLVMDPGSSTLAGAWRWHEGGGYFGVPLSNFLGWYGTVWLVFQSYALMIRRWPGWFSRPAGPGRFHWRLLAVLLYLAMALAQLVPYLTLGDDTVADPSGRMWHARDLREATVIVMAFSMLPSGLIALLKLMRTGGDRA